MSVSSVGARPAGRCRDRRLWLAWALASALCTFGALGALSVGLPFLIAGVALAGVLSWRGPTPHPPPGAAPAGVAAIALPIGLLFFPAVLADGIAAGLLALRRSV